MVTLFRAKCKSVQNLQTLHGYIFRILQYFATKLYNFTKLRKLFPTVLKLFSNLRVCLIGEWSIKLADVHFQNALRSEIISHRRTSQETGRAAAPPPLKKKLETASFEGIYFQISGNLDAETPAMEEFGKQMTAPPPSLTEIPYAYVISQSTLNVC